MNNPFNVIRYASHIPNWLKEIGGGIKLATQPQDNFEIKNILPLLPKVKLYNSNLDRIVFNDL